MNLVALHVSGVARLLKLPLDHRMSRDRRLGGVELGSGVLGGRGFVESRVSQQDTRGY